jgi:hypothetical protein
MVRPIPIERAEIHIGDGFSIVVASKTTREPYNCRHTLIKIST